MKRTSKSTKLPCAFCQGRGIQPGTERLSCIVCKGKGRITIKQPYNICKECGGRGKKAGANLYCLLCHGQGFVEESRHPLITESLVPKTRRKKRNPAKKSKSKTRELKPVPPPPKADPRLTDGPARVEKIIKAEVIEVKREKKSTPASRLGRDALRAGFFKKLLRTFRIL